MFCLCFVGARTSIKAGESALIIAARQNRTEILEILIKGGANVDEVDQVSYY